MSQYTFVGIWYLNAAAAPSGSHLAPHGTIDSVDFALTKYCYGNGKDPVNSYS